MSHPSASLDAAFRQLVREEVRAALRDLQPELLTPAQAGELVGRSPKTICRLISEGKLTRHGAGRPLVSRAELLALRAAPARRARGHDEPSAEAEVRRLTRRAG